MGTLLKILGAIQTITAIYTLLREMYKDSKK